MRTINHYLFHAALFITSINLPAVVYGSELTLAVANSTCTAIKEVGKLFEKQSDTTINYICKSSGRLAKGLNGGTIKADAYISANQKWMDYMINKNMVHKENVTSPWGNELVVASQANSQLVMNDWSDIAADKVQAILIGDPGTAPFGRYAKEALQSTGMWQKVRMKIQTKKHITLLANTLADSNANTVGILFASNIDKRHKKLYSVNKSWHSSIRYYMAPLGEKKDWFPAHDYLSSAGGNPLSLADLYEQKWSLGRLTDALLRSGSFEPPGHTR